MKTPDKQNNYHQDEAKRLIGIIRNSYKPEKIYVFGSAAREKISNDSDLDLLIIKNTRKTRRERNREVSRLLIDRKIPVDILVYSPAEIRERKRLGDFFIRNILEKGKLVYAG